MSMVKSFQNQSFSRVEQNGFLSSNIALSKFSITRDVSPVSQSPNLDNFGPFCVNI